MTTNLNVSAETKILTGAREAIERYGWIQENYGNPAVGFCLVGALRAADPDWIDRDELALSYLGRVVGGDEEDDEQNTIHWNDAANRTKEEVLAALDKAILLSMGVPQ